MPSTLGANTLCDRMTASISGLVQVSVSLSSADCHCSDWITFERVNMKTCSIRYSCAILKCANTEFWSPAPTSIISSSCSSWKSFSNSWTIPMMPPRMRPSFWTSASRFEFAPKFCMTRLEKPKSSPAFTLIKERKLQTQV